MWVGKSVGKCILFESKWIAPTVFENQLEISSANKWRSINSLFSVSNYLLYIVLLLRMQRAVTLKVQLFE